MKPTQAITAVTAQHLKESIPEFGVGDFPALLDKRKADTRYLRRLRSVAAAGEMAEGMAS